MRNVVSCKLATYSGRLGCWSDHRFHLLLEMANHSTYAQGACLQVSAPESYFKWQASSGVLVTLGIPRARQLMWLLVLWHWFWFGCCVWGKRNVGLGVMLIRCSLLRSKLVVIFLWLVCRSAQMAKEWIQTKGNEKEWHKNTDMDMAF